MRDESQGDVVEWVIPPNFGHRGSRRDLLEKSYEAYICDVG